jgi:uncharacterized protein (DUF305 family)
MKTLLAGVAGLALGFGGAFYWLTSSGPQSMVEMDHSKMDHSAHTSNASGDAAGPWVPQFMAANDRMHQGMAIAYSDNADVDFAKGMIPHHQGAIDMAKIVIAHGKDPEIRKLAEEVVSAQEGEIAFMQDWLKRNGQ